MNYPVSNPSQARAVLRSLRQHRGLTQAQAGALLGVSQKRIARIEADPGKTSLDQISRLVALLGADLVVADKPAPPSPTEAAKAVNPRDAAENW
jgi:HTH-type transcriptional regulator / antitoxin HipB